MFTLNASLLELGDDRRGLFLLKFSTGDELGNKTE
jgi:hypothetical protein